jgi:hypothetical protein
MGSPLYTSEMEEKEAELVAMRQKLAMLQHMNSRLSQEQQTPPTPPIEKKEQQQQEEVKPASNPFTTSTRYIRQWW